MKKRSSHFLFWFCLVVVFGVMGWLSFSVWKLEGRREQELARTRLEETTRLALWRMDSLLASLWAEENGRAPQEYFFITDKRANRPSPLFRQVPVYARLYFQIDSEGGLSSPQISDDQEKKGSETFSRNYELLASSGIPEALKKMAELPFRAGAEVILPKILKKERIVPEGRSPADAQSFEKRQEVSRLKETPESDRESLARDQQRDRLKQAALDYDSRLNLNNINSAAIPRQQLQREDSPFVSRDKVRLSKSKKKEESLAKAVVEKGRKSAPKNKGVALDEMRNDMALAEEADGAAEPLGIDASALAGSDYFAEPGSMPGNSEGDGDRWDLETGRHRGGDSISSLEESKSLAVADTEGEEERPEPSLAENSLAVSPFVPRWVKGDLFLFRTVTHASRKYVQGIWVDWGKMNTLLLDSVTDLLPQARLLPLTVADVTESNVTRTLAGLPLLIDPGALPVLPEDRGISTLELSLAVAWLFALAAAAGAVFLLWGMIRLSERRATFVSAVTHELRTPLTTFNLYTEMLTEGLVPEKKMLSYFTTLRQEALRLTHLVDNVMNFSRLEKSRPLRHPEQIQISGLKDAVLRHIRPRLEGAEMGVLVELSGEDAERQIRTDVTAVEQIMYNLADNAAKYAAVKGGQVVWRLRVDGKQLILSFQDEGAGIPGSLRKRLFRPFSRSAEEAAGKKPGVGLGLALSREIARDLGGDLKWEATSGKGACFVLVLPLGE